MPVEYKGIELDCGYRVDMIIEDSLVVELKAVERALPIHQAQILTYMKIPGFPLVYSTRHRFLQVLNAFLYNS